MKQSLMNFIFHPFDILMRVILMIHSINITDSLDKSYWFLTSNYIIKVYFYSGECAQANVLRMHQRWSRFHGFMEKVFFSHMHVTIKTHNLSRHEIYRCSLSVFHSEKHFLFTVTNVLCTKWRNKAIFDFNCLMINWCVGPSHSSLAYMNPKLGGGGGFISCLSAIVNLSIFNILLQTQSSTSNKICTTT